MNSDHISHYRILNKLGAGGMGEVYLAEDVRLGRQVALKFLPASYQYDADRRARLLKEARAASALRSPHTAAIYDIDEHEGTIFIVMEYVDGETLSSRISRETPDVREVIVISIQIADALAEAHSLGIVHCDVKGSNIIINNRGLVKMLDFGVARVDDSTKEEDAEQTAEIGQKTSLGVVHGTVSYMSPEQALGRALDHRTDIFSLGIVIYEMLAGRVPFTGDSPTQITDNILHQEPAPVSRFNRNVPTELERITRKCLEKDRERRYQSTQELLNDLRALQRDSNQATLIASSVGRPTQALRKPRSRRAINSLAILPLSNTEPDSDMEFLSDGITESIINNLSQLPKLRVMARSTVFRYKSRELNTGSLDPMEVGRELNVRAVLTGRVLHRDDRIIIKVELVDAADGAHLWGEQYNREMRDIFALEGEIAREISEKLRLRLTGREKKRLTKRHTENPEAYKLYLKGRYYWNKRTEEDLKKAIEQFEHAINLDSSYGLAYAGLADSYILLSGYSSFLPDQVYPIAKVAATRALELDPALAEAHVSLAAVKAWYEWDWAAAEEGYKRAMNLNPGYATAYQWHALDLAALGRLDEAVAMMKHAQEIDPLSVIINLNVSRVLYFARQYDLAHDACRQTIEIRPGFALAHRRLGQIYNQMCRYEEAVEEFERALALVKDDTETMAALGYAYATSGRHDEAEKILDEINEVSRHNFVSPYSLARIYAGLGRKEQALDWLEKAYGEKHGILVYLKVEPAFDGLRSEPRFNELLRRMNLA